MTSENEIMVDVLDLQFAEQHVLKTYKEQMSSDPASESFDIDYDDVFDMHITRAVARFITPNGDLYVLVEGNSNPVGPITMSNPLHLGVKKRMRKNENPHRFIDDAHVTLFESDLRSARAMLPMSVREFFRLSASKGSSAASLLRVLP